MKMAFFQKKFHQPLASFTKNSTFAPAIEKIVFRNKVLVR